MCPLSHEGGVAMVAIEGVHEGLEGCPDRDPSDRRVTTGGRGWRPTDRPTTRDLARRKVWGALEWKKMSA